MRKSGIFFFAFSFTHQKINVFKNILFLVQNLLPDKNTEKSSLTNINIEKHLKSKLIFASFYSPLLFAGKSCCRIIKKRA